jgi:hypothetical protein
MPKILNPEVTHSASTFIKLDFLFSSLFIAIFPQEAQALFARARLCLPYNEGRKETRGGWKPFPACIVTH